MIVTPRMLVLWVRDWPVVAAGVRPDRPAAVVRANRVVATTPAARAEGVEVGLRRREAQARCPGIEILPHDPALEARTFDPVVAAIVRHITPRVEVIVPGQLAFPTRGPARYHGGDAALADLVVAAAVEVLGVEAAPAVGIADGRFAALLAAMAAPLSTLIVASGGSRAYLEPLPVETLGLVGIDDATIEVLRRLGLRTLGGVAGLPASDMAGRFGVTGATAHRLARGLDGQPPMPGVPPADHSARTELDAPAEQVETIAFVARGLADDLVGRLAAAGLTCTSLLVVAETDHGERHERRWRGDALGGAGTLTAAAMVDRVRWQLDGWLRSEGADAPTAGVTLLELAAEEVVAAGGRQLGFWGRSPEADDGVVRAVARVSGLLGLEGVVVSTWRGSRDLAEQFELVPAAAVDISAPVGGTAGASVVPARSAGVAPWPGAPPAPSPAALAEDPPVVELVDPAGRPVGVDGGGNLGARPARLRSGGRGWVEVAAWAGPWTIEERWWDPDHHRRRRRRAHLQLLAGDGTAFLLVVEAGRWSILAEYD